MITTGEFKSSASARHDESGEDTWSRGRFLLLEEAGTVIPSLVDPEPVVLIAADEYWIALKEFLVPSSISSSMSLLLAILPCFWRAING